MEQTATTSSDGTPIVPEFNGWLEQLVEGEGSDLHVKVGSPPMIRLPKGLHRLDRDPLTGIECQAIADGIIPTDRKGRFVENGEVDFAYSIPHVGRFRVNVFRQRGSISMVLRKLRFGGPSFEEIGLPDAVRTIAERFYVTKRDLADPSQALLFLEELNPQAEIKDSPAELFSSYKGARKYQVSFLGPIKPRAPHFSGIRAHAFRPPPPVTWAGWSAWSRLAREEFGVRLIRVKGLLQIEDSIAFVQGVQGVFHPPQRFKDWPDDDRENRLVCISRDIPEEDIALTLPALNTPAGTQAIYSMQQLRERS